VRQGPVKEFVLPAKRGICIAPGSRFLASLGMTISQLAKKR
jgi:hypothetical protein